MAEEGERALRRYTTEQLRFLLAFAAEARDLQQRHAARSVRCRHAAKAASGAAP